ncbi:MAG: ABC transporter ATP-binding protein [Treponema sp.]|jgi:simple sugar transport system ATP-binding protein|nr:ABC transporter ATP-binding protein [Treponema sp.]
MSLAIEMAHISKRYSGVTANDDVSISVSAGEILGLIGENGAGKTTMMKMLYGMVSPDEGDIRLFGKPVKITSPHVAIKAGIGMVHQHFMLMPNMSVLQNIILGQTPTQWDFIDEKAAVKQIDAIMDEYDMRVDVGEKIFRLSVGEKQRVEIIKSLFRKAKILILDEPTAVLTPHETDRLLEVMQQLKANGTAIIFITHKLREVMKITDKITVMRRGRVTGNLDTRDANPELLSNLMVGRSVDLNIPRNPYNPGKPVLELEGVFAKDKRGLTALHNVNFLVRAGEIVGIAGVEGNGQTELIEVIAGIISPTRGTVRLHHDDITGMSVRRRREKGMSHIPEDRLRVGTSRDCSIRDNLILNRYYQKPFSRNFLLDNGALLRFSEEQCEKFSVKTPDSTYLLGTLSGGNMQKVVLARELEVNPDLLIAAQPTRGVDIGAIETIHQKIVAVRDAGKSVLLISAELDEILSLSDRILVMYEGEIMAEFNREDATERKIAVYMTGAKKVKREIP